MKTLSTHADFIERVNSYMHGLIETIPKSTTPTQAAIDAVAAGGKRLRPLLVFATRPLDNTVELEEAIVCAAAAIELIHTASLVHDDLLDGATLRRGIDTTNIAYGRDTAIATGDLLFSLAFTTLASSEKTVGTKKASQAVNLLAAISCELAEGEALQAAQAYDVTLDIDSCLRRCNAKTASLFEAALVIGANFYGASVDELNYLARFGRDIGLAFQITDDLLDLSESASNLGKTPGADLRDGTITLPIIFAIQEQPALAEALASQDTSIDIPEILELIHKTDALSRAQEHALALRDSAILHANKLEDRFDNEMLCAIAEQSVTRLR